MTEEQLCARLKKALTEERLRDALNDASGEDDRGRHYTDIGSVAEWLADWLAQECCDENQPAMADATGHP